MSHSAKTDVFAEGLCQTLRLIKQVFCVAFNPPIAILYVRAGEWGLVYTEWSNRTRCNRFVSTYRAIVARKLYDFDTSHCCTLEHSVNHYGFSEMYR